MPYVADLDLEHSLRPGLDILANEIVIALKKRTRFPHNRRIYAPGLVRSHPELSLLDYELAKIERAHAELGRYTYPSQEAFTPVVDVQPVIERRRPESPILAMDSRMGPKLLDFYCNWIETGCAPGDDSDSYGETVTADVDALLCMLERVNLGKYVAESKLVAAPDAFRAAAGDHARIRSLLVHADRERQVYTLARSLADHYDFDAQQAVAVFQWMIETTIDIEIAYVERRIALDC